MYIIIYTLILNKIELVCIIVKFFCLAPLLLGLIILHLVIELAWKKMMRKILA